MSSSRHTIESSIKPLFNDVEHNIIQIPVKCWYIVDVGNTRVRTQTRQSSTICIGT